MIIEKKVAPKFELTMCTTTSAVKISMYDFSRTEQL